MAYPDGLNSDKPIHQDDMLRSAVTKGRQLHVGVVGAGFAGLRCADVLLQHGHKVTIFEARNRLGGRVCLPLAYIRLVNSTNLCTGGSEQCSRTRGRPVSRPLEGTFR